MKTTFTCTLTLLLLTVLNFAPADAQQYVHTQTLTGHTRSAYSIAFKDDTTLISGRTDDTVRAWNVSTGTQIWERDVGDFVYAVAVPAHSPFYVAYGGYSNHDIRFRYTDTGNWRGSLTGHTGAVLGLAFKPGQHLLASASFDDTIRIWNTADKTKLRHVRTLRGHTHDVYSVAWSPDGTTLASGSSDGTVRLWNPNNGINFAILRGHKSAVYSIAWSPDGQTLASGSGDQTIRIWSVDTERTLRVLRGHTGSIASLAFHPNGSRLASGGSDSSIRLWNPATGASIATLKGHSSWVVSLAFNSTGDMLVSGSLDKTIRIYESLTVDVSGNGSVTLFDLARVAENYGKTVAGGANPRADVNKDGRVDIKDLIAVASVINPSYAQVAPAASGEQLPAALRAAEVQTYLQEARAIGADAAAIAVLEQLLAALTQPEVVVPKETALLANYPNPFNPETWIPYQLAEPADVRIAIHSADGALVRQLVLGALPAGVYQAKPRAAYWDGKNAQGEPVASGVYFYTLKAGEFSATKKMLIRK